MLAHKNPGTPVVVAEKRTEGMKLIGERFRKNPPDVVVLDDGFQHRRLHRNLDIVVINAVAPLFDDRMLPAGRLREPLRNLRRADLLVLGKLDRAETAGTLEKQLAEFGKPLLKTGIETEKPVHFAGPDQGKPTGKVIALAGIAEPEQFVGSLQRAGMETASRAFYADHAEFPSADLQRLVEKAIEKGLPIVTTEKDYFRLLDNPKLTELLSRAPCYYLPMKTVVLEGEEILERMLEKTLSPGGVTP